MTGLNYMQYVRTRKHCEHWIVRAVRWCGVLQFIGRARNHSVTIVRFDEDTSH